MKFPNDLETGISIVSLKVPRVCYIVLSNEVPNEQIFTVHILMNITNITLVYGDSSIFLQI
jgi:hypothetical protein